MNQDYPGFTPPTQAEYEAFQEAKKKARESHVFNGIVTDHFNNTSYPITSDKPIVEQDLGVHYISGTIAKALTILPTRPDSVDQDVPLDAISDALNARIYPTPKYDEGTRFDNIPKELQALNDPKYPQGPIPPAIKYYSFNKSRNEWQYWLNVGPYQERQNVQVIGDHYDSSDEPILESILDTYSPVSHEEILARIERGERI
jgi:hypothetical protein